MLSGSPLTASRKRLPGSGVGSHPVILVSEFLDCKVSESKDRLNSKGTAIPALFFCPSVIILAFLPL